MALREWEKDIDLRACTQPNCEKHGKSPCTGVGCDGRDAHERAAAGQPKGFVRIAEGQFVTLEQTLGWATPSPTTRTVAGTAVRDDEGTLRVDGVNVEQDAAGYFPRGVLVLSIRDTWH